MGGNRSCRIAEAVRIFAASIAAVLAFGAEGLHALGIDQVSTGPFEDRRPQLNEAGDITWFGKLGPLWYAPRDIFVFDSSDATIVQITDDTDLDAFPVISDTGHVAWNGDIVADLVRGSWDHSNQGLYVYDPASGTSSRLSPQGERTGLGDMNRRGDIAWRGCDPDSTCSNEQILVRWAATGQTVVLTDTAIRKSDPLINDRGDVIWIDYAENRAIQFYEAASGTIEPVPEVTNPFNMAFNAGGDIVYSVSGQIRLYDRASRSVISLTQDEWYHYDPRINDGQDVLWTGGEYYDIFYRDGETGTTRQLTMNPYFGYGFFDTDLNRYGDAVWIDYGPYPNGNRLELYCRAMDARLLVQDLGNPTWPQLNDAATIVWEAWNPLDGSRNVYRTTNAAPSAEARIAPVGELQKPVLATFDVTKHSVGVRILEDGVPVAELADGDERQFLYSPGRAYAAAYAFERTGRQKVPSFTLLRVRAVEGSNQESIDRRFDPEPPYQEVTVSIDAQLAALAFPSNDSLFTFDGSSSSDPDGTVQSWTWEVRDADGLLIDRLEGPVVTYDFQGSGTYNVSLTVADDGCARSVATTQVTI